MYSTSTLSTTTSGSAMLSAERRVRAVRLLRPRRAAPAFGFSLRGGKEYATGFFISKVELNSEAHLQGLKVGDQVISVNGYRVDDAIHGELVHYIASQSRLKLKVRHVGMIPVKEKEHESLSWQFTSERASITSEVSSSPTLCHTTDHLTDLRLSILVPPRAKLGCGICKGPDWKPGIFVQFIREGGIAREAGLRPGDQILSCNGLDFGNISFNDAIAAMKVSGRLELVIREGAGTELVSPESSGYNSSASSAAGERSPAPAVQGIPLAPPAALRRRLASVAEEAADRAERLTINRIKRRTWDNLDFNWKRDDVHNFDIPSDIEPDYDCPSIPNNPHTYENKANINVKPKDYENVKGLNRTIINLTEDGATIQCSYDNNNNSNYNRTSHYLPNRTTQREEEKKTIFVEVHHMDSNSYSKTHCSYPPPPKKEIACDNTSMNSSNSLSSAIAEEIQRRKLNKKTPVQNEETTVTSKKPNITKTLDTDQKKHHDALMDEFKKVHRKMFLNQEPDEATNINAIENNVNTPDRQVNSSIRKESTTTELTNGKVTPTKCELDHKPPPPPPMPVENGNCNGNGVNSIKDVYETDGPMKIPNMRKVATLTRIPTPDYSNKTDTLTDKNGTKTTNAEVDSLESYKLKNTSSVHPKPPSNYFVRAPNGTETMKKHARPVSVTIGQYVNNIGGRKEPAKLEFLNGDKKSCHQIAENEPISSRLQSELALTLSRSNLRKKTEALGDGGR
ncbi:uncharacterized protein LOC121728741 isoform X2 [Aricia agestis]|uniref:uncharacterized protein LOC121728741 isoform X2 n=1 Tax=Aricia agestis TaxID=91739 RepID=UPI001C207BD2|nr:uncharacterized protein LOC121728741 isoform X2 [Aricia agestis]